MTGKVLIVEDDREMRGSLVDLLEAGGWITRALSRATEVAKALPDFAPDVIVSDVRMPGMSGLELLESLTADDPPVVLISAHGDIPMAVQAMSGGAYSFVEKPYDPRRLLTILSHAAQQFQMRETNQRLRARLLQLSGLNRVLLGASDDMARVRAEVLDLADTPANILVRGETGTGKELVARALHDLGRRGEAAFLPVNAALLTPQSVVDAAMAPNGGTLFLDEICACPIDVQAMLLRIIDAHEVMPEGAVSPVALDLRIISATNEDVEAAVAEGRLRSDLLFRLNTVELHLPALRDRKDDVVALATHFLTEHAQTYEIAAPDLSSDDMAALLAHDWPGNVRELRSVAERRVLAARRGMGSIATALHPTEAQDDVPDTLREAVAAFERQLIAKAITAHDGRMDAVAEALGIGRRTLNEKIVKLGLNKDDLV